MAEQLTVNAATVEYLGLVSSTQVRLVTTACNSSLGIWLHLHSHATTHQCTEIKLIFFFFLKQKSSGLAGFQVAQWVVCRPCNNEDLI